MRSLFLVFVLFTSQAFAQSPCELGPEERFVKTGDDVVLTWEHSESAELLYFRIRCAEKISGPFNVCYQVPYDARSYTFKFNKTASHYYFMTAWYAKRDDAGTLQVKESAGSNMIRVRWTK